MDTNFQLDQERGVKPTIPMPELPGDPIPVPEQAAVEPTETLQEVLTDALPEPEPALEKIESPSSKHFKAVRDLKERAERERDEAIRRAQELEARYAQPKSTVEDEDFDIKIGNDELAEGKHLNKVDRKIKKLEDQLKQYQQQASSSLVEARLKMEYPDIEKVVSKENIEILTAQYPHIAATLNASTDLYNQAVTAYTLIKKFGIQPEDTYQQDRIRAQTNALKPRPLTSVNPQQGDSPLSHANAFANGLTDELKAQLLKEMVAARR